MWRYLHFIKDFHKNGAVFGHKGSDELTLAQLSRRSGRNFKEIEKFINQFEEKKNENKE